MEEDFVSGISFSNSINLGTDTFWLVFVCRRLVDLFLISHINIIWVHWPGSPLATEPLPVLRRYVNRETHSPCSSWPLRATQSVYWHSEGNSFNNSCAFAPKITTNSKMLSYHHSFSCTTDPRATAFWFRRSQKRAWHDQQIDRIGSLRPTV